MTFAQGEPLRRNCTAVSGGIALWIKIGEYRLKIYELFYHRPICEYAETDGRKKTENVLILGSGWIGVEAFKAVFWAGQCLDSELNITVASQNASAFQKQVLSGEPSAVLPALRLYTGRSIMRICSFRILTLPRGLIRRGLRLWMLRTENIIILSFLWETGSITGSRRWSF